MVIYAVALGLAASFFFAFTFVLNHSMALDGGNWLWNTLAASTSERSGS